MITNRRNHILLAFVGLVIMLSVAYGGEILKEEIRQRNAQGFFPVDLLLWSQVLITVIIMGVLLAGSLIFLRMSYIPIWLGLIYLVVGLYIIVTPILFAKGVPVIWWFVMYPPVLGFDSFFYLMGTVVTMLGLFRIIRPNLNPNSGRNSAQS